MLNASDTIDLRMYAMFILPFLIISYPFLAGVHPLDEEGINKNNAQITYYSERCFLIYLIVNPCWFDVAFHI